MLDRWDEHRAAQGARPDLRQGAGGRRAGSGPDATAAA